MSFRVQIRRDPSGKWIVNNPILLSGEFGYETDTSFIKIGDGVTPWNYLPYWKNIPQPRYKVFTALLTQSGSANSDYDQGFPLIIGQSYQIYSNDGSGDFINVGAPNNNVGTWFIATGTMPDSWGTEGEVALFYNTSAPVATVLENTVGNIWFTYETDGAYLANSIGLFIADKTVSFSSVSTNPGEPTFITQQVGDINAIVIRSFNPGGEGVNGIFKALIEIRVYN